MAFKVLIVDNNLLRLMTYKGNLEVYENYFSSLEGKGYLNEKETKIIITAGGVLEYLAIPLPTIRLPDENGLRAKAEILLSAKPFDASSFNQYRTKLLLMYERELRKLKCFSKSVISRAIGIQRTYVEPLLEDFVVQLLKKVARSIEGREILYSRVAIDRMILFPWPEGHRKIIMQSYMADAYAASYAGFGFSSMRGFGYIWKDFYPSILERKRAYILDKSTIRANIDRITSAVSLKSKGDFLDAEAIHYAVIGRFVEAKLERVIFCSNDPVDSLLIRISVFKSIYTAVHQMMTQNESEPTIAAGIVMVFNQQGKPEFEIRVDEVPLVINCVIEQPIQVWLKELKEKFKC